MFEEAKASCAVLAMTYSPGRTPSSSAGFEVGSEMWCGHVDVSGP